jgi:hypothetical protein
MAYKGSGRCAVLPERRIVQSLSSEGQSIENDGSCHTSRIEERRSFMMFDGPVPRARDPTCAGQVVRDEFNEQAKLAPDWGKLRAVCRLKVGFPHQLACFGGLVRRKT